MERMENEPFEKWMRWKIEWVKNQLIALENETKFK